MAVTNYFTVDGQIYGEETGGTFRGYVPDALGSVMATTTTGSSAQNTYRYKPYGEQLAKTGAASDPEFLQQGSSQVETTLFTDSPSLPLRGSRSGWPDLDAANP